MITEVWKDIKGYEGFYQVSNLGRVRSLDRINKYGRRLNGKILKPSKTTGGYYFVILSKNGFLKNYMIHRLVAKVFLPNKNECVNHIDGNKENNQVSNLQWCTFSENRQHAYDNGFATQRGTPKRVRITDPTGYTFTVDSMILAGKFFGFKKGWLQNRVRKHGSKFKYNHHLIEVTS